MDTFQITDMFIFATVKYMHCHSQHQQSNEGDVYQEQKMYMYVLGNMLNMLKDTHMYPFFIKLMFKE